MTVHVIGLLDNEEQAKEVKFIAKLLLVGNRARELARNGQNKECKEDDIINMYQPKGGEK